MATNSAHVPPFKKRKLNTTTLSPISRVVHSSDYFEVLELAPPVLDDLNRVIWTVQKSQIKKQYFKISRQVHPDRHTGDESESKRAASSFDTVQNAFNCLSDSVKREQYVNEYGEKLKYAASKHKYDTNDNDQSLDKQNEDLESYKLKRLRRQKLMEQEANEYEQSVMDEFNQRVKRAEMKRVRAKQMRKLLQNQNESDASSKSSDDSDADSDIECSKILSKLKRNQQRKRKRFR